MVGAVFDAMAVVINGLKVDVWVSVLTSAVIITILPSRSFFVS